MTQETQEQTWVLVEYSDNWADEMDLDGFFVIKRHKLDEMLADIHARADKIFPTSVGIGSNGEVDYADFDDFRGAFSFTEISDKEYNVLKRIFGTSYSSSIHRGFAEEVFDDVYDTAADDDV